MYFVIRADNEIDGETVIKCIQSDCIQYYKKYKLNLKITEIKPGYDSDDFIRNMTSYRVQIKN